MARAWLRGIPDSFANALTGPRGRSPDVGLAREQHAEYRERLEASGLKTDVLDSDEAYPDCVFIEDTAVLVSRFGVITRPGAPERRGEIEAIKQLFPHHFPHLVMDPPATLDGGDVLIVRNSMFVGLSSRTNLAGVALMMAFAHAAEMEFQPVQIDDVLHLKSGVLAVSDDIVVVTPGTVNESIFGDFNIIHEHPDERHQFSAVRLPDRVLVTSSAPKTSAEVERAGVVIDPIDVSEILAADGGLTCMSIIDV